MYVIGMYIEFGPVLVAQPAVTVIRRRAGCPALHLRILADELSILPTAQTTAGWFEHRIVGSL